LTETLKIIIPMAGWGTRMRPHTWNKPKPLVGVAGKTSFEHLMDIFKTLPDPTNAEFVFIVGPHLGEDQIPPFVAEHYPELKAHYVVQTEMKGQSHAIYLAREFLHGPMIMVFSDTLIETDFSFLKDETSDGVAWVKPVPDPRRFGVAEVGDDGWITRLIEKPQSLENNLAVVGCYYFKRAEVLAAALKEQMRRKVQLNNEFFLVDAINIMLEGGAQMRTNTVQVWLDTGTIEATLETNRYLLEHGRDNTAQAKSRPTVEIVPPVFIHPSAEISQAVIGPHVSVAENCTISQAVIQDSIIEAGTQIERAALNHSLIGRDCQVKGEGNGGQAACLNIGDDSSVIL
jgi:glucose-1-phosphate thymidylyltransferase